MKSYIQSSFEELIDEDGLCVYAAGLGIDSLFIKFIQYSVLLTKKYPGSIVICINLNADLQCIQQGLTKEGVLPLQMPHFINNDTLSSVRRDLYQVGGCFVITSRILIVDMLKNVINIDKIIGMLVYNAHTVIDDSLECFILRVYNSHQSDKANSKKVKGFVKAFTAYPEKILSLHNTSGAYRPRSSSSAGSGAGGGSTGMGCLAVENLMCNLYVKKLYLVPRFHGNVIDYLERDGENATGSGGLKYPKGEVEEATNGQSTVNASNSTAISEGDESPRYQAKSLTEYTPTMSPLTQAVQGAILVAMSSCLKELKANLPSGVMDTSQLTIESGLFRGFDYSIKAQLSPVWYKLSPKVKQLIEDLKILRTLTENVLRYDSVMFYSYLNTLKTTNTVLSHANAQQYVPYGNSTSNSLSSKRSVSYWIDSHAGNEIYKRSKERIYSVVTNTTMASSVSNKQKKVASFEGDVHEHPHPNPNTVSWWSSGLLTLLHIPLHTYLAPAVECPTKWQLLDQIVSNARKRWESKRAAKTRVSDNQYPAAYLNRNQRILVITKDTYTAVQLTDVLTHGAEMVLLERFRWYIAQEAAALRAQCHKATQQRVKAAAEMLVKRRAPINTQAPPANHADAEDVSLWKMQYDELNVGLSVTEMLTLTIEQRLIILYERVLLDMPSIHSLAAERATEGGCSSGSKNNPIEVEHGEEERSSPSAKKLKTDHVNNDAKARTRSEIDATPTSPPLSPDNSLNTKIISDSVVFMTVSDVTDGYNMLSTLNPTDIVVYDCDLELVRLIERYKAGSSCPDDISIHFMLYSDSTEEKKYSRMVNRELSAFEQLIQIKSRLVVTLYDDIRLKHRVEATDQISVSRDVPEISLDTRTTTANSTAISEEHTMGNNHIVVDIREFRSILPNLLHASDLFTLVPETIYVGDFVLTNDLCVERKGIPDLYQSFASGRLYNQVNNMLKYYQYACLLIEFSPDKPFALQASSDIPSGLQINHIISRICLLTMAFPRLKILWSRSQHDTVSIFHILKAMYTRSGSIDIEKIKKVGSHGGYKKKDPDDEDGIEEGILSTDSRGVKSRKSNDTLNNMSTDILLALPGINQNNVSVVCNAIDTIADLCQLNEDQLTPLIGASNAKLLVTFLNQEMVVD